MINVNSCADNLTIDAGLVKQKASLGNYVWEDLNYNGLQDAGEKGIQGVTVKLLSTTGAVLATTTTDSTGYYSFNNLDAGSYKVQVVSPTGYYVTKQTQGADATIDSNIDTTGTTTTINLAAGQNDMTWDAGLYRKCSVGDRVWVETNNDGIQNESGAVAAAYNVKVMLYKADGTLVGTQYTDTNGNYLFANLDPGQYYIVMDKTSGKVNSGTDWFGNIKWLALTEANNSHWVTANVGTNDAIDSDVLDQGNNLGKISNFTLVSGQYDSTRDGGICPIVIDLDGNGITTVTRVAGHGATFDLLGNGHGIESGWIGKGEGLLAVDTNGNGKIDSIAELFGGNGVGQGFAKLASFDSNHDGVVDAKDARFAELRVWVDANGDHKTDAGELKTLAEAGVSAMKVSYTALPAVDENGNVHLERSSAVVNGKTVDMTDVYFNVDAAAVKACGGKLPNIADLLGDDRSLDGVLGGAQAAHAVSATPAAHHAHADDAELVRRVMEIAHREAEAHKASVA